MKLLSILSILLLSNLVVAQQKNSVVWVPDLGNGSYKNPVLNADYSDPDAIRVGDDYYLIASSFSDIPGLPILHSKDLVNWKIIGHALHQLEPFDHFSSPQHGNGVWAPAIRFHKGEFYIYYPDPDFGIFMIKTKDPSGNWSTPVLVEAGKGLIDPCPFWDDNGETYLVHGWAGSRAGIKSVLTLKKMNKEGTKVLDAGVLVYDGHEKDPTVEGPKMYKRNGYYYLFAPAGGVSTGWQLVLRSKNIYGPYERKVVMDQGKSDINGPHQGAWVTTQTGEDWFLHFQDKGVYGRVVHLQPLKWLNDWPVIGNDPDNDGKGEPVKTFRKPNVGKTWPIQTPPDSDEFNSTSIGKQWQWPANSKNNWVFPNTTNGSLRLYASKLPDSAHNLWDIPELFLQKLPADMFMVTTKLSFHPNIKLENEEAGLVVMGMSYGYISIRYHYGEYEIYAATCTNAVNGKTQTEKKIATVPTGNVILRMKVFRGGICRFSFSLDGNSYTDAVDSFQAEQGKWIGAKMGLFSIRKQNTNDAGYADFDWFHVEPVVEF